MSDDLKGFGEILQTERLRLDHLCLDRFWTDDRLPNVNLSVLYLRDCLSKDSADFCSIEKVRILVQASQLGHKQVESRVLLRTKVNEIGQFS